MLPAISVIVPTYNGEAWIADTLDSVFSQTHPAAEIIVVDDASTDGTVDRVAGLANDAPIPVHLIRRSTGSGSPAPTINAGIAEASGDFIAVLDQDDEFLPSRLDLQARALASDPALSIVFSLYRRHDKLGKCLNRVAARSRVRHFRRRMTASGGLLQCDGSVALEAMTRSPTHFFGGFPGFTFRRSAWHRKGGLDESFLVGSDFEFVAWLCTQGAVGLIPEILYHRHEHGANISRNSGIRGHLDVLRTLLRYGGRQEAAGALPAFRAAIRHHLWRIARRLASGGHRQAARDVAATLGTGFSVVLQRLAVPAYAGYYRLIMRPWQISNEQARESTDLARTAARQLAQY